MADDTPVLLLVSPGEADLELVREQLADGTEVHWVTDLNAALAALVEHRHDIVLLATELAGREGVQRLRDEAPHTPVIELADASAPGDVNAARARGAVDHLPRHGLAPDTLRRALRYAVEHQRTVERLQHDAVHDGLTGLPNRALFVDRLAWALRRARRPARSPRVAVLFLDVDRFKAVNDSLGHQAGDELLRAVAHRLGAAVRPGDTVARIGGDEFTVLLEDSAGAGEAVAIADRIQRALGDPILVSGRAVVVSASIGVALAGPDGDAEDLIRDADVAMYRAKAEGKARHAVFEPHMYGDVRARRELEEGLRRALREKTLGVRFQPIVRTDSGAVAGFEALCRWEVDAAEIIRIADASGLIVPLGRFVLDEAARRAAEWGVGVAVNVSGRQLRDPGFATMLESALEENGASPDLLRLEVTETDVGADPERALRTLLDVRDRLGVQAHLDDFGAGVSSLQFLHRFPGIALKIDRTLIATMLTDPASHEIVKAMTSLAHTLRMAVVAEGVESAEHLDRLVALGCDYAQGFHIAPPLTAEEARELLDLRAAGAPV